MRKLILILFVSCTPVEIQYVSTNSITWNEYENLTLHHVNLLRDNNLLQDDLLYVYAKKRAKEISLEYSHAGFNEVSGILIDKGFTIVGENIGYGYSNPESLVFAWSESQEHNSIMINKIYKYVGVSTFEINGKIYICMLLGV